jgi:hypothetical protein
VLQKEEWKGREVRGSKMSELEREGKILHPNFGQKILLSLYRRLYLLFPSLPFKIICYRANKLAWTSKNVCPVTLLSLSSPPLPL